MRSREFPYEVVEELIRGGSSALYKIRPRKQHASRAGKYVLKSLSVALNSQKSREHFYMEYEFLRAYPHRNLVAVKEYFPDWHGRPAYVMEWVRGHTWQGYWEGRDASAEWRRFLFLFQQLCEVLDYVHGHQIVHQDLKPSNILISERDVLKLIDFGIMKVADLVPAERRRTFMGSAFYMAPEVVAGGSVTRAADMFALGVMLYELFTRAKPFEGLGREETLHRRMVEDVAPPSALVPALKPLDRVVLKMLDRQPHRRYASGRQLLADLKRVVPGDWRGVGGASSSRPDPPSA